MKLESLGAVAVCSLVGGCAGEPVVSDLEAESSSSIEIPILITPRVSAISEAGEKAYVTIALPARPHGKVSVLVHADVASEVSFSPSGVTFTPFDWAPRTIEVSALDDQAFDGDIPVELSFSVATRDRRYKNTQPDPVDLLSVDDDYEITGYRALALAPGIESRAVAINNRGQVVGEMRFNDFAVHPFVWDNGVLTSLGSLENEQFQSHALGMSDTGAVVGWSDTSNGVTYWRHENGAFTALPGEAHAINDRGSIAGDALYVDGQRIDFRPGEPATGLAINDRDDVAGKFPTPPFHERAFLFDGTFVDIGSFGGPRAAGLAINESNHVVGKMFTAQINYRPFLYDGTTVVDLGTTGAEGAFGGTATGINNRGDIVGSDYDSANEPMMGWIGRPGNLVRLDSLLVDGSCFYAMDVTGVNDRGEITMRGHECGTGSFRAFLLQPEKVAR